MNPKICILLIVTQTILACLHAQQPPSPFKTNVLRNEAVLLATCDYFAPTLKTMKGKYEGFLWSVDSVHNRTLNSQLKKLDIYCIFLLRNIVLDMPFSEDSTIMFEKKIDIFSRDPHEIFVYEKRNKPFRRQPNEYETIEMIRPGLYYYTYDLYKNVPKKSGRQ